MKPIPIPVVAVGPGSRAPEEEFDYLRMPAAEPLATPIPPQGAAAEDLAAAAMLVERLIEAMRLPANGTPPRLGLASLRPPALRALNESLGQGEVSAVVRAPDGTEGWHVQETAFAGVWRVQRPDGNGGLAEDLIEAGDMPQAVKAGARIARGAPLEAAKLPEGVMNAPALVNEIRHHARRFRPGRPAHVINLSLLPLTPADHDGLGQVLGEGAVTILSRGFGNCRINATRARGVWRVRYFNSMNTVILDTIEVVDFPESARAGAEDYDDSIERLHELLRWLRES